MSFIDRLQTASYKSPSGSVHTFAYTKLERAVEHRVGVFEFAGIDGTLHQDKGVGGETYPLTIYFSGPDYDKAADAFLTATKERGPGVLVHPRWGKRRVQIVSGPTQVEEFVRGAGEAIFNVTFQESLEREYPEVGSASEFGVPADIDDLEAAAADNFGKNVFLETLADINKFKDDMLVKINAVKTTLAEAVAPVDEVAGEFFKTLNSMSTGLDSFVSTPSGFARSLFNVMRLPARITGRLDLKLQGFSGLLSALVPPSNPSPNRATKNRYLIDGVVGTGAVVGVSEGINQAITNTSRVKRSDSGRAVITVPAITSGFRTRAEVLAAALYLRNATSAVISYLDGGQTLFKSSPLFDAYVQALSEYDPLAEVSARVIKTALDLSFDLPTERKITLPAPATVPELCYRFYGSVDDAALDYFILTNGLTGDNILLIPRGREVVFYA